MPVVALVNQFTASAAEIVSGALQDHDRALVLGTATFGKGVAYVVFRLSETEAVSVTTSRWYTPVGRSININRPMASVLPSRQGATAPDSSARADSADIFYSNAGRALHGGGGIRPDIILRPDTLTEREKAFATALGANVPKYRDAMARFALDLKGADGVATEDFEVTDAMLAEFWRRLETRGVELPDSIRSGARALVAEQLSYEIARYVFGRPAELRRRARDDNQIRRATDLLQGVGKPSELFARAQGK
jgi:carboxyl-terminal processing protease